MEKLLNSAEAAKILNVSVAFLNRDRCLNAPHPKVPYIKLNRAVKYKLSDVEAVINSSRIGELPNEKEK